MSDAPAELPSPDERQGANVVIFDGQCRFCTKQVQRLHAWDSQQRLAFLSLHDPRVAERYPDLSQEQLMEQMYLVDESGRRFGGADAFRQLAWKIPRLYLLAPLLYLPLARPLAHWCYRRIAKRRYQMGRIDCGDDACRVHF